MRLVHISDLHLTTATAPARIDAAVDLINAQKADAIVCTGDIVSRTGVAEMTEAYKLATAFRDRLQAPVYTVPGNHDLYDGNYQEIDLYARLWAPQDWFVADLPGGLVLGLNSARQDDAQDVAAIPDPSVQRAFAAAAAYIKRGDIIPEQVQRMTEVLAQHPQAEAKILALHHHLIPLYNPVYKTHYNYDMVGDAADLLEILRQHRFRFVLNGHKHTTQLNVLNGVSHVTCGALFLDLPAGVENSFNVIDVAAGTATRIGLQTGTATLLSY